MTLEKTRAWERGKSYFILFVDLDFSGVNNEIISSCKVVFIYSCIIDLFVHVF